MEQNTPELWDKLWKKDVDSRYDLFALAKEECGIRWQRMERIVLQEFGSWKRLRVLELGAGAGTNAALMARCGAEVTVLDFSEAALERSKEFFERHHLHLKTVCCNVLDLPKEFLGSFDIAMSFGLTEHFRGLERFLVNKAHVDVLKSGGLMFISVPNKYNPPYRILAECLGVWKVGEEYPYSRQEFKEMCQKMGVSDFSFFGDSVFSSFHFLSPWKVVRKIFRLKDSLDPSALKKEHGTALDQYLAYALVLTGKRP